jgi:hypothetical protein
MNNVVSLEDISKEDKIKKLENELKAYKLQEKVEQLKKEISDRIAVLTVEYAQTVFLEDMDGVIGGLEDLLEKLEPFKPND